MSLQAAAGAGSSSEVEGGKAGPATAKTAPSAEAKTVPSAEILAALPAPGMSLDFAPGAFAPDQAAAQFLKAQVEKEAKRVRATGQKVLPVPILNCCIVREQEEGAERIVNRIELGTKFDFFAIRQILVSPPVSYPEREGYKYVNVVLLASKKALPLLCGYLYDARIEGNDLTVWRLVNMEGLSATHTLELE